MSTHLICGERKPWTAITAAARSAKRADVAVAYFGKNAAALLPLRPGSRLVVDASERTVRAGATHPGDLRRLTKAGVLVYSRPGLHAKVFAFPRTAFIGSTNVSQSSASHLAEALLQSSDPSVIRGAREFVLKMSGGVPMGPEELKKLQTIYRPPRGTPFRGASGERRKPRRYWFDYFEDGDPPAGAEDVRDEVHAEGVQRRSSKSFECTTLWHPGGPKYREGDVIFFAEFSADSTYYMTPPGTFLNVREWSNGKARWTFYAIEYRERRRMACDRIAKKLGRGWKSKIWQYGMLKSEDGRKLAMLWDERG